jgi:hypothetical protein
MVLAELMDMEIPFCSEQIIVEHQLSLCNSPAAVAEFAGKMYTTWKFFLAIKSSNPITSSLMR